MYKYIITEHNNINMILMLPAQSEKTRFVTEQSVVISSQPTRVVRSNEHIASLNMAQLMIRETKSIKEHHCLKNRNTMCANDYHDRC